MSDEFDDLKRAFDRATPGPDPDRKARTLAEAEKIFRAAQGSADDARPMFEGSRWGRLGQGVERMLSAMTTRGGLTATTALVAVARVMVTPAGRDLWRADLPEPVSVPRESAEAKQVERRLDTAGADQVAGRAAPQDWRPRWVLD